MAVYLDEDMMGGDPDVIGFPHLLLCMGLVCVTDDRLLGIHLTNPGSTGRVVPLFSGWLRGEGVSGADLRALYGAANFQTRYGAGGGATLRNRWEAEMTRIAGGLGYAGPAFGFDASVIAPKDGFYAEFVANHATHQCRLFYKRNEKMVYQRLHRSQGAIPALLKARPGSVSPARTRKDGTVEPEIVLPDTTVGVTTATVAAGVKRTRSNGGLLHEVNYGLRLIRFTIA